MSRRRTAEKREIQPDPKFGDVVVSKFMNCLMYEGKKSVTESIVYGAFEQIQKKSGNDPVKVFHDALDNVKPAAGGALAARRRRHLSGAGRGAARAGAGAGDPLADHAPHGTARKRRWSTGCPASCWMPRTIAVPP